MKIIMSLVKIGAIVCVCCALLACQKTTNNDSVTALTEQQKVNLMQQNDQGVAIDGYSPVSYFERGKAEPGSPQFSAHYNGVTYWLTDSAQLLAFNANPEKYAPAHGGWCSLMMSGSGNLTPANPESWKIVNGKLLLFWAGQYKDMQISGLKNWASKTNNETDRELKRLADAEEQWQEIQQGKNTGLVIFSQKDNERLNAQQRAMAKDASQ
ncbi:MAG: hypothetical protein HWD86_03040 [Kangiellaceae bacterium]|nr:hypothetical protein [Kangiellaceae bacterium]